jgi:hypothetical protein
MSKPVVGDANLYYANAADTVEYVVSAAPCILLGIIPDATTAGTTTLRDAGATGGTNTIHLAAIGLTQQGKSFASGVKMQNGLTIQLSSAADKVGVIWTPLLG